MLVVRGTQQLRCKATQERCHQARQCSRVLVVHRFQVEAELIESEWSDEVRALCLCSFWNNWWLAHFSIACDNRLDWCRRRLKEFDRRWSQRLRIDGCG